MQNHFLSIDSPLTRPLARLCLGVGLVTSALFLIAGCATAGPKVDANAPDAEASLVKQIDAAIGSATCSTDSQCRTIGLGAKACGGPAAWRPWSIQTLNTNKGDTLQKLSDQLATLQRSRQAQSGMVSTCSYLPDPGAVCEAQRCVLKVSPSPNS